MVCSLVWCMHPTDADYRPCGKKRRERVLNGRKHTPRREHSQNTGLTPKSRHFIHSLLPRLLSLYSKWPTISKPTLPTGATLGPPAFLSFCGVQPTVLSHGAAVNTSGARLSCDPHPAIVGRQRPPASAPICLRLSICIYFSVCWGQGTT